MITNYDRTPVIKVPGDHQAWTGPGVWAELDRHAREGNPDRPTIVIDTYPGVRLAALAYTIAAALPDYALLNVETASRSARDIDSMIAANLTTDRVFGQLGHHVLADFYDCDALDRLRRDLDISRAPVVIIGWGAALVEIPANRGTAVTVLADLSRWEIQQRQRQGAPNWHARNEDEDQLRKVKRGYFVEWRVADRHKRDRLFGTMDYLLDTTRSETDPVMITGKAFRAGLDQAVNQPFRLVPFFDPGVWGGTWMEQRLGLPPTEDNYAWCFDCVPEENSLLLAVDDRVVEIPAMDLVLSRPHELLGAKTFARFGAEFPIRFDLLDTMQGQNLSLQVHPMTGYIQEKFGMHYTQDESYYLLDAEVDAVVYLGLRDDADPHEMFDALHRAQAQNEWFRAEDYVNTFPAAKHDHFSIPAGTVHCSGRNCMVLEISATPYIFTFKMWDWGRLGLDGVPRPVHLEHAAANVQWDRRTAWVRKNLVDQTEMVASGPGWVEERTGLHELEFIEVRRHWFTDLVEHDTYGTVNVINLVEGAEAVVESPAGSFAPFVLHYAETMVIPANVGRYTIRPHGPGCGTHLGTVKASVRGTQRSALYSSPATRPQTTDK